MWQEATLKILHESGVKTFASFEPTIEPQESLALIERTLRDNSVDHYKIGKINHYQNADGCPMWSSRPRRKTPMPISSAQFLRSS